MKDRATKDGGRQDTLPANHKTTTLPPVLYDLDGVLVNDVRSDAEFPGAHLIRCDLPIPLFTPAGRWGILTGRPMSDIKETDEWVRRMFPDNPPEALLHGNLNVSKGVLYKLETLLGHPEVKVFVESCEEQASVLRTELLNRGSETRVVSFKELIRHALAPTLEAAGAFVRSKVEAPNAVTEFVHMVRTNIIDHGWRPDHLLAVARGGLTFGHSLARRLRMPLSVAVPSEAGFDIAGPLMSERVERGTKVLVIDDLLAKGRTIGGLRFELPGCDIKHAVYVTDAWCPDYEPDETWAVRHRCEDWIVFPWEDFDEISAGDHGLFRDGTSTNG